MGATLDELLKLGGVDLEVARLHQIRALLSMEMEF
jgi:hypothetical protein